MNLKVTRINFFLTICLLFAPAVSAADWPFWGRDNHRNMVSPETNIAITFVPGKTKAGSEEIDMSTTSNVKWVAKLGSQSYGNPTVLNGKIFLGTNNEAPRNPKYKGDYSTLMAFDEANGSFLWQLAVPKLGAGKVNDWEYLGICSSPAVEGNRVYAVTNRCEVICLDVNGLADGNDGPFTNEAQYVAGPGNPPIEQDKTDADIIWVYDMRDELGVFPHNITSSSVLIVGDTLYVTTSNGQDWSHVNIPSPNAPAMIAVNKNTGKLAGEEVSGISKRLFHCNWSSPGFGSVGNQDYVFFGGGDGILYAFDPKPVVGADGFAELQELWRFDLNPEKYKTKDGQPIKYPHPDGPSEAIGTPVFYKNRVYIATGQDPEHGTGLGILTCINVEGAKGDITKTGALWTYDKIQRSISTVAIAQDLVFAADYTGFLHCLDANTGQVYWVHDTESNIWSSPLVVDGRVYQGNEDGVFTIMAAAKEKKVLAKIEIDSPIHSSPIVANGVLYITTQTHLFAVQKKDGKS